jgi:hypothetical protein
MLENLKRKVVNLARRQNIYLTGVTSQDSLLGLLHMLKPMATGHELIRIGGDADGGYLIPDDLDGVRYCFSPGVSTIADFELALAERGIKSFLADFSVERSPVDHPLLEFDRKFLGRKDAGEYMTLETWVNGKRDLEGDMILQMDIEGAEYDVLFSTPSSLLRRFRILVVEFHDLDRLAAPDYFAYIRLLLDKLTQDFVVSHIHPNNYKQSVSIRGVHIPPLLEMTMLRKDRVRHAIPRSDFPHQLDRPNIKDWPDVALPSEWFD